MEGEKKLLAELDQIIANDLRISGRFEPLKRKYAQLSRKRVRDLCARLAHARGGVSSLRIS